MYGNGLAGSYDGASSNATAGYNNHKNNNMPAMAGNKENAKPVEYILRRPRGCTLLAVSYLLEFAL